MSDNETEKRRQRAEARRERALLVRTRLGEAAPDSDAIRGVEALSLVTQLTRMSWSISGRPWPRYQRSETPYRFVAWPT